MASDISPCTFDILKNPDGEWTIVLSGSLNINTAAGTLSTLTSELKKNALTSLKFDLEKIIDIDDYGALVLYELKNEVCDPDTDFQILNPPEKLQNLMTRMKSNNSKQSRLTSFSSVSNLVIQAGETAIENFKSIKYFITFIGSLVMSALRIFQKPKSLRFDDIIRHMKTTGVDAVPVVALISFLLGLIMAFMSSLQLKQFGANIYVASLVALAMVSELGPIMTAIIVSGRSGSAFAAEISTMKISEEVDALLTMGFDPVLFLAIPRIIAAIIVIPLLTMFANLFAISGGLLIGVTMLDLSATSYISQTINSLNLFELFWGLSKSLVFAILISCVGCLRGFQAKGGASAVGHAATSAVVTSIFLIVLFDSIFAVIRSYWG
ncbi:MAG: ABC transporter permease [Desulfobacteraceae bacterium]|nr:ABC transporter permease [Desulfobacteraceae bacterium]MBC2755918.1 ABC transporter permease [Desulfobacteraceae bacterium]